MSKMQVLIAGAAGFLGSHLSEYHIKSNDIVVGLDNLSTGYKKNLEKFMNNDRFYFIEHDITKKLPDNKMADYKFDVIYNLASPASPVHYQRLGIETLMTGSLGTYNLLELAKKNRARFLQASTSEVYGDPEVHPQPESYKGSVNCYGPRSMYDESKRFSEALIYTYRKKYSVNTAVARFFNTYGPRMDVNDGRVVSNFIVQAINNKPMTIYGDGGQTRSFCYVDDLINGIILLADSKVEGPINLGNPSEFTILELATLISNLTGTKAGVKQHPLPKDDPLQRKPVIKLAKSKLNWEPKVSLNDGLKMTIKYFQEL